MRTMVMILACGSTAGLLLSSTGCALIGKTQAEQDFIEMRDAYVTKFRPLLIESNKAWWDAATTGSDDAYARRKSAENALAELHGDKSAFAELQSLKDSAEIKDPTLRRELLVMYNTYLPKQADSALTKRIIELEADVDQIFNTHRSEVDGKKLTENDVRKILKETTDSDLARKAWTGYMAVGRKVDSKLRELVSLRNKVASKLGYKNYFAMQMEMQEFDEQELFAIFDELDRLTRDQFAQVKLEIDAHMANRFGMTTSELRPWHTDDLFFQEAPDLADVSLDDVYQSKDPVELSAKHFESMGYDVAGILSRSDLYEKEGKSPHAFCTNIDRDQDVRVLCNVKPNSNWMDTVHHELGHGVYDQYIDRSVPFLLREPSHILTTEGVAMFFGALTKNAAFLRDVVGLKGTELDRYGDEARRTLRYEKLIFSRWTQVMLRFERELYSNPNQDLNKLWWSLKKKYQLLNSPEDMTGADYGAKYHVVGAPVYYHNYMLGDLFAAQVQCHAAEEISKIDDPTSTCFYGDKKVGKYLLKKVYAPGNLYNWQDLTKRATSERLSAKYYSRVFLK